MEARGIWRGGFETRVGDGRGHLVTVDLPVDEGGKDSGTSGLELMVLSLVGCVSTIFTLIAHKRKLTFDGIEIALTAVRQDGAPTIERIHGTVEVTTSASREDVDTVLRLTLKTCPVGVLLERAHIPVELVLTIVHPPQTLAELGSAAPLAGRVVCW